ncbi:MAG: DUF4114 domain-containing protein [Cyanobacteria bacterium P01_A01_bin.84]
MPQVGLTTSTNFNGLNALVENQGNTITFRFDLDEAAPAGGLRVFVDSNVVQIVNRLDLPGFAFNPVAENINPATFATDFDNSGFAVTINEGATSGSFTIPIFDNPEPDTFLPATFDGLVEATFSVKTAGEVAAIDASNIAGVSNYTVNSGSAASAVLFADDASQLPAVTPPTFSITASETVLVEDEGTTTTFTIQLVDGTIPDDGQVINIGTGVPFGLGDFLVSPFQGAVFENVVPVQGFDDSSGLSLRVTDSTARITLPIFNDGDQPSDDPNARNEDAGVEQVTFSLLSGDGYSIAANQGSVELTLADTRSQLSPPPSEPVVSFSAAPTTISEAEGTALVMNFSVTGDIPAEGVTVKLEGDAARIMQQFTAAQTRFDSDTGEIFYRFDKGLVNNNVVGGTLELFSLEDGNPSEAASNPEAAGDAFLTNFTFTITEANASITLPVFDDLIEEADATYTYNLVDGEGYAVDGNANSATFTVTDGVVGGGGPTVGVSATPTTLVESQQTVLTLTFTTQGDIPPEGVVVALEGAPRAIAEFDVNATNPRLPESETVVTGPVVNGGNIVGTNEVAGALFFRITEPTATITVPVYQDDVAEGTEILNFNLRDGELYNVDQAASAISVTINDAVEPVVSFSATPTTISEAEGTALVMNFSVNGDIPPEGIAVTLEGDAARIMQQFTAAQTRFDSETGEIFYRFDKGLVNNNVVGGTLDLFALEADDPNSPGFLSKFTFVITEANASITIPVFDDLIEEADATYTYNLVDGEGYAVDGSANSATFSVTDGIVGGGGPTVGVSATPTTLIESEQTALTLTFTTQGDIPPEGVVVVLEGSPRAIAEFDVNATNPRLPESETVVQGPVVNGGNIVGTDETAGSLVFRIFEPTATITVPVYQDDVIEGTENLTFNLRDGELYNVDQAASSINLSIEDGVVQPAREVFNINENSEVTQFAYNLTGAGNNNVNASLDQQALEITDAMFENMVGFYEVVDENGGIDVDGDGVADFNPGDDGYARAALENAVDGIAVRLGGNPNNDTTAVGFGDTIIEGGKQYAAFAIANAGDLTVEEFLEINPNNDAATRFDDQVAYFAFGEANPDGANHLKSFGNGVFGFEDLPSNLGASDNDFNDAVFKFNFTA